MYGGLSRYYIFIISCWSQIWLLLQINTFSSCKDCKRNHEKSFFHTTMRDHIQQAWLKKEFFSLDDLFHHTHLTLWTLTRQTTTTKLFEWKNHQFWKSSQSICRKFLPIQINQILQEIDKLPGRWKVIHNSGETIIN